MKFLLNCCRGSEDIKLQTEKGLLAPPPVLGIFKKPSLDRVKTSYEILSKIRYLHKNLKKEKLIKSLKTTKIFVNKKVFTKSVIPCFVSYQNITKSMDSSMPSKPIFKSKVLSTDNISVAESFVPVFQKFDFLCFLPTMANTAKLGARKKYENHNILRTKKAFHMKQKPFLIIF